MRTRSTSNIRIKEEPSPSPEHFLRATPAIDNGSPTPASDTASIPSWIDDFMLPEESPSPGMPVGDPPNPNSKAPQVWSLRNIRQMIMDHLNPRELYATLRTSKECFGDASRILYRSVDHKVYKRVERLCTDVHRLRYYTTAIREIDISRAKATIGMNAKLFAKLPNLQSITQNGTRLVLNNRRESSPFSPTTATIYQTYERSLENIGEGSHQPLPDDIPKNWIISRHIDYAEITGDILSTNLNNATDLFFELWSCSQGLFANPITKLKMSFNVSSQQLFRGLSRMIDLGSPMPKIIHFAMNELPIGPTLRDIITSLSLWVEEIKMISCEDDDGLTHSTTTILEFFSHPLPWPEPKDRKYKPSEPRPHTQDLEYFAITLNANRLSENGKSHSSITRSLPALSQIARGMLKIGGNRCQYALKVTVSIDDLNISETLTTLLRREFMEILKYRFWRDEAGWKLLTPG